MYVTCSWDKHIKIYDDLSISKYSFSGCYKLKTIVVSKIAKSIKEYGFYKCGKIKSVIFSKESSVINIEDNSFLFCNN